MDVIGTEIVGCQEADGYLCPGGLQVDSSVAWQCPVCAVSKPCPDTVHGSCCVSD